MDYYKALNLYISHRYTKKEYTLVVVFRLYFLEGQIERIKYFILNYIFGEEAINSELKNEEMIMPFSFVCAL